MLNCYLVLSHCFCTKYPTQTDFHASSKSEVVAHPICRTHSRVNVRSEKWACNQTTLTSATILMCSSCNATLGFKMSQGLKSSRLKYLVA